MSWPIEKAIMKYATKTETRSLLVSLSPCLLVSFRSLLVSFRSLLVSFRSLLVSFRSLLVCVPFLAGCDTKLPGKPNPADRPVPIEKVLTFDTLYARNCAGCHGKDGSHGAAPPLNDPLFRAIVPIGELTMVLQEGRKQGQTKTAMAPFAHDNGGPLSEAQVQVLVHEIKGLKYRVVAKAEKGKTKVEVETSAEGIAPQWGVPPPAPPSAPTYILSESAGDSARGAKVFAQACAACHGVNGQSARYKINDATFLSLISDQELRRIVITGRADLKMPDYAQKTERGESFQPLTSAQVDDLIALLREWRGGKTK
jgi:cytochrome c oxidase cbb3-type subunit III